MAFYQVKFVKPGATFATKKEAVDDKDSMYGPELLQQVKDCHAQMVADGVLLRPIWSTWEPETFTVTVYKEVSSLEAYDNAVTFDRGLVRAASILAGWTPGWQEEVTNPPLPA